MPLRARKFPRFGTGNATFGGYAGSIRAFAVPEAEPLPVLLPPARHARLFELLRQANLAALFRARHRHGDDDADPRLAGRAARTLAP